MVGNSEVIQAEPISNDKSACVYQRFGRVQSAIVVGTTGSNSNRGASISRENTQPFGYEPNAPPSRLESPGIETGESMILRQVVSWLGLQASARVHASPEPKAGSTLATKL